MSGYVADVKVRVVGPDKGGLRVASPYHPSFIERAKGQGGQFDRTTSEWVFDARDAEAVRGLCREVYGTDGSGPIPTCTVALDLSRWSSNEEVYSLGRLIAKRPGRDHRVVLGEGVTVLEGRFPSSGGSMKYPNLASSGVVVQVRDVPCTLVEILSAKHYDSVQVIQGAPALADQRQAIEARIAKLRAELAQLEGELAALPVEG